MNKALNRDVRRTLTIIARIYAFMFELIFFVMILGILNEEQDKTMMQDISNAIDSINIPGKAHTAQQ